MAGLYQGQFDVNLKAPLPLLMHFELSGESSGSDAASDLHTGHQIVTDMLTCDQVCVTEFSSFFLSVKL